MAYTMTCSNDWVRSPPLGSDQVALNGRAGGALKQYASTGTHAVAGSTPALVNMKIIHDVPPILDAIIAAGMHPHSGTLFAYGDELYIPSGLTPPPEILAHEKIHQKQQMSYGSVESDGAIEGRDAWWGRYLADPLFRIQQEAEAYAEQYRHYCKIVKDRNAHARYMFYVAGQLSGPMYGGIINHGAATKLIKSLI